ncbi:hypothetical protein PHISP_01366 [Aspergillus sp. HF37]|nr:hypothetical protein PHISP_01366 [Aspergillus sp. HF37]
MRRFDPPSHADFVHCIQNPFGPDSTVVPPSAWLDDYPHRLVTGFLMIYPVDERELLVRDGEHQFVYRKPGRKRCRFRWHSANS